MQCRSCGSKKLKTIVKLGNFYLSDFIDIQKSEKKYPLTLLICTTCKLVQLEKSVPSEKLYTERYGYRSGINTTIREDLKEITTRAMTFFERNKKHIKKLI
jgi:hypothetical protein